MASAPSNNRQTSVPSIRTFSSDSTGSATLNSPLSSPTTTLHGSIPSEASPFFARASSTSSDSNPASPSSTGPAERGFFGALVQKATRSRSRSRNRVQRCRSRSPLPPQPQRLHHQAPVAMPQSTSVMAPPASMRGGGYEPRPHRSSTSSSEDFYYGRHANQWLFGNFSIRDTVRDVVSRSSSEKPRKN